ncbi:hypothetical protein ARMSODRAFT_540810 [Armillaria solidipes]|uniref:Uncharacterized protein n=1 Tax=Armillaria solidipes TaxID=1076256 RepID=A0A2H3BHN1_9AGAR|nr:hypothetical protein ARMSODRAFT_540810 [Armillaria solidipes]
MSVITSSCPKCHRLYYFPSSAASHPHKVFPSRSISHRSLRGQRSSSAEKPVVLKLVSPADRPPIATPILSRGDGSYRIRRKIPSQRIVILPQT